MKLTYIATALSILISSTTLNAQGLNGDEETTFIVKEHGASKYTKVIAGKDDMQMLLDSGMYESVERDAWIQKPEKAKRTNYLKESNGTFARSQSTSTPNDPEFSLQYYFKSKDEVAGSSEISNGINKSIQNKKLRFAVIDGGFEDHSDLTWDYGYNFFDEWGEVRGPEFRDLTDEQKECSGGHGLGVASIIGATSNNGIGISGVIDAEMVALRVLSCGIGPMSDMADAIYHAAGASVDDITPIEQVDIINISIAGHIDGGCPSYVQEAIDYANDKGIMIFVAAGNKNEDAGTYAPASCDGVYVSGASDQDGYKTTFSNHGEILDTMMAGIDILGYASNGVMGWWEGTSQASPLTAGVAGLGLQHNPELTREQIFEFLKTSSTTMRDDVPSADQDCSGNKCGSGLVNASAFMDMVISESAGDLYKLTHALSADTTCDQALYMSAMGNTLRLCELYELNIGGLSVDDNYKVVRTDTGTQFDSNSEVVAEGTETTVLLEDVDLSSYSYGVRICTTDSCETETVLPINTNDATAPAICD